MSSDELVQSIYEFGWDRGDAFARRVDSECDFDAAFAGARAHERRDRTQTTFAFIAHALAREADNGVVGIQDAFDSGVHYGILAALQARAADRADSLNRHAAAAI